MEPVSSTEAITTSFGYDAAGNQTRLTDGRGNKTTYTFNSWGLPESTIEPSTAARPSAAHRTWTTVYDKAGQAVTELPSPPPATLTPTTTAANSSPRTAPAANPTTATTPTAACQAAGDRAQLEGCGLNGGLLTAAQGRTAEEEASRLRCA
ncbi:RHS repeat domain-containing protein [Streptomyces sp. NPDC005402]|uniref:RHS repeat domain-containing protein n=1 Tax=Streptomyces sp. NPDC005402 TaxID=3155338 RepID=UPI0033B5892E